MTRFRTQIREVINRNTVVSLAMEKGFNAYLPVYDGGVDFILYREEDSVTHKVQLKGRWIIDRKYIDRASGLPSHMQANGTSSRTIRWCSKPKRLALRK